MQHLLNLLLASVLLVTVLPAQVHLGTSVYTTTQMVDASGAATGKEAALDKAGTNILIGNGFGVYVIVEIRDANGDLLFSGTVPPNDALSGTHNLPTGEHNVLACDAGNPPPQQCGTVCVN